MNKSYLKYPANNNFLMPTQIWHDSKKFISSMKQYVSLSIFYIYKSLLFFEVISNGIHKVTPNKHVQDQWPM